MAMSLKGGDKAPGRTAIFLTHVTCYNFIPEITKNNTGCPVKKSADESIHRRRFLFNYLRPGLVFYKINCF